MCNQYSDKNKSTLRIIVNCVNFEPLKWGRMKGIVSKKKENYETKDQKELWISFVYYIINYVCFNNLKRGRIWR